MQRSVTLCGKCFYRIRTRFPDLEELDGHEAEEGGAGDEQDEDVDDVRKSVPGVPESSPDLTGLRKVDDQKRPQGPMSM